LSLFLAAAAARGVDDEFARADSDWRPPALPLHLAMSSGSSSTVFLGTFTGGPGGGMASDHGPSESEGIYTAAFNADTGVSELCPAVPGPQPASQ
jgi:hypothetical protein